MMLTGGCFVFSSFGYCFWFWKFYLYPFEFFIWKSRQTNSDRCKDKSAFPPVCEITSVSELRATWPPQKSKNFICARNIHCEMWPVLSRNTVIK